LEFRVQDTGIGMSDEQMSNLFRAFSQADTSVTRKFGGTGLGLVISKRLVEMMGGTLWVDSHPQAGSIFGFSVWLGIDDTTTQLIAKSGYRVLVVDDNDLARKVLERLLAKLGCIVQAVDSGEAALAALRNSETARFDCVMVDLYMPNMDGLALGHHIRAECGQLTKLVMVTSENIQASPYSNALGDFDDVVEKPVTAARIGEVLSQLQNGKNEPSSSGQLPVPLTGLRILVAEDVPTNQLIMRDLLESLGATISIAGNGQLALQKLATSGGSIDLILMDIQMPEMDGLEATRRIRAGQVRADIPIIALTAHALEEERQRASHAGMNDFLTKPIEPAQLISVIQHWMPLRAAETSPLASAAAQPAPEAPTPDLPGIDYEDGLRRMLNRRPLYEKVLRDFHARFSGETERIREALAADDVETATRLAHSLKGTGAMISATSLPALAAELEQALRNGAPEQLACLDQLDLALSQVLGGIKSAFKIEGPD
jgi:CheY-like chemotaxis protein/HPt (histidine-containing phosphotransfer) domain-containing protein